MGKPTVERQHKRVAPRAASSGARALDLPDGISTADWALERRNVQNPSLRSYLGCIRLVEEVLDSNYAILHCSPDRLLRIWRQVEQVRELMRSELLPTLRAPSVIPALDAARRNADASFRALAAEVLAPMDRHGQPGASDKLAEVRRLLCVSIGRIHAFLRDSFGEIVASDPRSRHDADYFLSRRFAQDIEESEWLYAAVYELDDLLRGLERAGSAAFAELLPRMQRERMVPSESEWEQTRKLIENLQGDLLPKLKEVISLRGIRVNDMEALETHAWSVSGDCRALIEVHHVGRETIEQLKVGGGGSLDEREQKVRDIVGCHRVVSSRMLEKLTQLQASLRGLAAQIAAAKSGIEKRRALMLAKDPAEPKPPAGRPVRRIR